MRFYTYQLAVLIPAGIVLAVYAVVTGELRYLAPALVFLVIGVLGYLHGRKDD